MASKPPARGQNVPCPDLLSSRGHLGEFPPYRPINGGYGQRDGASDDHAALVSRDRFELVSWGRPLASGKSSSSDGAGQDAQY